MNLQQTAVTTRHIPCLCKVNWHYNDYSKWTPGMLSDTDTMDDKVRFQELDPSSYELLRSHYKDPFQFARFGDIGCTMPISYKDDVDNLRNMAVRPDDVWVVTFPRSGTTWTQELVWLLMNDFDYTTASKILLMRRYLFLELKHVAPLKKPPDHILKEIKSRFPPFEAVVNAPSPRFIKTHLPFSLLPPSLLDTTKVVYVARDPRDVAVSCYHKNILFRNYEGDFKSFWNLFINDLVNFCPFFPHLKQAWALRHHPNMFFLFYEDMSKDLPSCVKLIAEFLGKEVTNEQVAKLCEHLNIDNFRKNKSVNPNPSAEGFVRKGVSGGWREYFDEEMAAQAQRWLRENLAGTDLRFSHDIS